MLDRATCEDALARMVQRIDATATARPSQGFPHYAHAATGEWVYSPGGDWTGGFWNGLLWLAAAATGDPRYSDLGREWAEALLPRATSETVFRGFLFWYGAALGPVLNGDATAREIAIVGARGLASLYNPAAQVVPLGNDGEEATHVGRGEANIDGVPGGVPLLVWAAAETGADELREMARAHARRHVEMCVRADGSVGQSASFDPVTGEVTRRYTHKGVSDDSTWTRAQAWAMLGYAQAGRHFPELIDVAERVSDWWLDHLPAGDVAAWDFDDPGGPRDTSGTAIAAAALLKLAELVPSDGARFRERAERMVAALVERHLTPVATREARPPGMLLDGCYNRRIGLATANELIWGDYFLFEALCVLTDRVDSQRV